MIDEVKQ